MTEISGLSDAYFVGHTGNQGTGIIQYGLASRPHG